MDFGIVSRVLGLLLIVEAVTMTPSLAIAYYYKEDGNSFLISILIMVLVGIILASIGKRKQTGTIRYREGFMIVGVGWILASIFGALPFTFSGSIPSFIDAVFETVSGFTTTGATIMTDIEIMPKGILFWRSFTHWLGGMGILVFTLALLPALGFGSVQLYKAESPGPSPGRLVPRIGQTAKLLYIIYFGFTFLECFFLVLAGMSLFDAMTHSFATMGTGGFSTLNASVGGFQNHAVEWIIIVFMLIAATNFSLFYGVINGNFRSLFRDSEFRFYMGVFTVSVIAVTLDIVRFTADGQGIEAIRQAAFQVSSIVTTTGFTTVNFELWPAFSKMILFLLMFIGGSSGSTGGAIKQIRVLLILKFVMREINRLIHPRAVIPIRVGDKTVPETVMNSVMGFVVLYILIFCVFSIVLQTQGMDIVSATSAVAATLGNIGPGFGMVGAATNYAALTNLTKVLLTVCMLLGRLELYSILILFIPSFWKK
jgi:trk system potassium uptake protein TrkH